MTDLSISKEIRRTILGMSEEFYEYGTLTQHDLDKLLKIQRADSRLRKYFNETRGHTISEDNALEALHEQDMVLKRIVEDKE